MDIRWLIGKIIKTAEEYPVISFENEGRVNTCINPYSYHLIRRHPELFESMDGLFVDGMTMCWLIRVFWWKRIPRLSFDMSSMAADLFEYLNSEGTNRSVFFLGTKQEILEKAVKQFERSYPNMYISGYRNGYFIDKDDRDGAITDIIKSNSDFAIIGMGSPLQEQFAIDLKDAGYKGIIFTCGGFLHQSAAKINYYPGWVNKYNLRAFYRLFHEKGLWGRLYNVLIEFPLLFTWDSLLSKSFNKHKTNKLEKSKGFQNA